MHFIIDHLVLNVKVSKHVNQTTFKKRLPDVFKQRIWSSGKTSVLTQSKDLEKQIFALSSVEKEWWRKEELEYL